MHSVAIGLLLACLASAASPAVAQGAAQTGAAGSPSAPAAPAAAASAPNASPPWHAQFFDAEDGQLDLSEFLSRPRTFLPIPIVITEPAVGYGGGVAGMFLRPRREEGSEGFLRPNISAVGAAFTQNGTKAGFAGDSSRWMGDRLRTLVGAATGRVNLDFYGLGDQQASLDQKVRYTLDFTGAVAQVNWQLAPKSPWAVGMRYVYANVEPKLRDDPLFPDLADRVHTKISAPTAILEYDTRDSIFTPTRGIYAETSYLASRESLGSTEDFERFEQVLIGWLPVSRSVILGAHADYTWSSKGTPFFLRPFISLRGVEAMRYQGDRMGSLEGEARWRFHDRWSAVAFGGFGTAKTKRDTFSETQNVGAGGLGIRYTLARKFGMDVGLDVAKSPGTTAVYLVVGNSWFRP